MRFKDLIKSWPFFTGLLLGLFFITFKITGVTLKYFPGDLGDARFNIYILEHAYKFFTFRLNASFWDAPFMYPDPNVITYSDNLLGSAPFYAFFRILSFERTTSFQLWYILMTILNYTCCYFFLNSILKNKHAAVLGAMIFAFSMALLSQVMHAQTFPRFPIPLAFWAGWLFFKNFNPKYFFFALLLFIYQVYCGIYLGVLLAVPLTLFFLISLVLKRHFFFQKICNWRWIGLMLLSFIVNFLLILPLIIPYQNRADLYKAQHFQYQNYDKAFPQIPTIKSYLCSEHGNMMWDFLNNTCVQYPNYWDHQIFPGGIAFLCFFGFLIFILIAFIFSNKFKEIVLSPLTLALFLAGFITFLLFLRIDGFSLYELLFNIGFFSGLRAIQRIVNVELIFFGFAVAYICKILFNNFGKAYFLLFAILIIIDNYSKEGTVSRTEKSINQNRVNNLVSKMKHIPKGAVVSYEPDEFSDNPIFIQLDAMLAAQALDLKSVNGYSGNTPGTFTNYWVKPSEENRKNWFDANPGIAIDTVYVVK